MTMMDASIELVRAFKQYLETARKEQRDDCSALGRASFAILAGQDLSVNDPAAQIIRSAAIKLRREAQAINRGMA